MEEEVSPINPKDGNILFYGRSYQTIPEYFPAESVDLVYLDPPFNSKQDFNLLFAERDGSRSEAQIRAFTDTWTWDETAVALYEHFTENAPASAAEAMRGFRTLLGQSDMMAYLANMAPTLLEIHRALKQTGSMYIHCDPTASHYLKVLTDSIFGPTQFRNEIPWRRTGAHNAPRRFGPIHDVLLFYSKTDAYYFKPLIRPYMRGHVERRYTQLPDGRLQFTSGGNVLTGAGATGGESGKPWKGFDPSKKNRHWAVPGFLAEQMPEGFDELGVLAKLDALYEAGLIEIIGDTAWPQPVRFLKEDSGQPVQDIWAFQPYTEGTVHGIDEGIDEDVKWLGPTDPERVGYPTQKPIGLLERVINASCPPGGVVLDPFVGGGTTVIAAQKLGRVWHGIDVTHLAIAQTKHRLFGAFGPNVRFVTKGAPEDAESAAAFALNDRYEFQNWVVSLFNAQPTPKGADRGIDGRLYFHDEGAGGKTKQMIFSVKSGNLAPTDVRDLKGTVEREKAAIGILITLKTPTKEMRREAADAGSYTSPATESKHPKIQIITVEEIFAGKAIDAPAVRTNTTYARVARIKKAAPKDKGNLNLFAHAAPVAPVAVAPARRARRKKSS